MSNKQSRDDDAARFERVLKKIAEITVDEWEAKIAYYAAETAKLELIEQALMTSGAEPRTRSNRPRSRAASIAPAMSDTATRKLRVSK